MIVAERATYPVTLMCRCLEVSCSGFYAWLKSSPSEREVRDDSLAKKIREIHRKTRETYGSPRIHRELIAQGEAVGHKRVERLMRKNGIMARFPRRRCTTTVRDDSDPVAENVLNREFTATAPNEIWVGITHCNGGPCRNRSCDHLIKRQVLPLLVSFSNSKGYICLAVQYFSGFPRISTTIFLFSARILNGLRLPEYLHLAYAIQ